MKPSTPICKSFQMFRQLFCDEITKQYILIGPVNDLALPHFPIRAELSGYIKLNSVNGTYLFEFLLQNSDGETVWKDDKQVQYDLRDPIRPFCIALNRRQVHFPHPGRYDFVLLANGEEVVRDAFWVHLPGQTLQEMVGL